jgi:4-amino-4-deoxy-L-arabinose transferase-like glycosyltransferase
MQNKFVYFSIFTLLVFKLAAVHITEFSLYGDEAQYWLWSKSIDLGYYSKPPLLAWLLSIHTFLLGDSFFSIKVFPLVVYLLISFGIYRLCSGLSFSKNNSILCAGSFLIIPAASISSFLISTDLLLLLFWTLSLGKILEIRNNNSSFNFFLLGLFLGLSFLAKYAAIYFFICLLFLIIIDKKTLNVFKNSPFKSLIFLLTFFLILFPNIYWNLDNEWATLSHTSSNASLGNLSISLYDPLEFLVAQIIMLGPILGFSFIVLSKYFYLDFENKFLLAFSLPIILIVLVESFLVRANANWAAPALISLFILLFRLVLFKNIKLIKINYVFNYCIAICLFGSIMFTSNLKIFERISGTKNFANEISKIIKQKDLVISDRVIFSSLSYEMKEKTNKIFMPHQNNTPITNHFQMKSPLSIDYNDNFYLIGELSDVSYLLSKHQGGLIKEFDVLFSSSKLKLYEVNFK